METVAEILTRIGREDYLAYISNADVTEEQWKSTLEDAMLAEQILNFTDEEKQSWEAHMTSLRKRAQELMVDAPAKAWDNLIEGETFELNPERYWRRIISDLEKKQKAMDEVYARLEENARREAAVTESMMGMYLENNPPESYF